MLVCRNHLEVTEGVRRCARCGTPYCPDCTVDIQGRPYCATCKTEQLLDVRSGVDMSQLDLASPWKRFGAIIIDGLLINMPLYAIMMFYVFSSAQSGDEPHPLISFAGIPLMFVQFIYEGLMLSMKDGQTVGKMAAKVKVVRPDGTSITTGQAWGRAAMKMVLGCLWIVDYIPAFFTQEKTTVHDMVAGTRVVNTF
jgi:uncharacterized RDD family membrane protein YckC